MTGSDNLLGSVPGAFRAPLAAGLRREGVPTMQWDDGDVNGDGGRKVIFVGKAQNTMFQIIGSVSGDLCAFAFRLKAFWGTKRKLGGV